MLSRAAAAPTRDAARRRAAPLGRFAFAFALPLLGLACGEKGERERVGSRPTSPKMAITAPISGAFLDEGAPTVLQMECRGSDGAVTACGAPIWWLEGDLPDGGWGAEGAEVEVLDLPPGTWALWASAEVAGVPLEDSREINVFAAR